MEPILAIPPAIRPAEPQGATYRLVYVSGSGRSGSTMLERILHSAPGVFAAGEFHCLWRQPGPDIRCACGTPFAADPFWQAVLAEAGIGPAQLAELAALERAVSRTGMLARAGFSLERLGRNPSVRRFLALQDSLFRAIAKVSGRSVLVDSSKAGPRAWLLALLPAARLVHLHRDPADVLVSWRSAKFDPGLGTLMKRMPVRAAAAEWWKVDRLAGLLARQRPIMRVDYERLCAAPRPVVEDLWARLRLSPQEGPQWLSADTVQPGANYHSLNGNPDRFDAGPLRIAPRRADWSRLAPRERPAIRLAAAALRALAWQAPEPRRG